MRFSTPLKATIVINNFSKLVENVDKSTCQITYTVLF